jgi:transcriptional regulator of acetoin/glycerol metabolism
VPLGNGQPVRVDFVLLCATNRDLSGLVRTGAFRADLYFRVAQYSVDIKPLSASADPAGLIDRLWADLGGPAHDIALGASCRERLAAYEWPGNFRQLVGCLRAMLALAEPGRVLGIDSLPQSVRDAPRLDSPAEPAPDEGAPSLDRTARAAMREALEAAGGNVSLAARRLRINRSTLYRRLIGQAQS